LFEPKIPFALWQWAAIVQRINKGKHFLKNHPDLFVFPEERLLQCILLVSHEIFSWVKNVTSAKVA
jgi:hypothetical protein